MPALQRMLDYTDEAILELEQALADKLTPAKAAPAKAPARKRATVSRAGK